MAEAMVPFRGSNAPCCRSGPPTDAPADTPLIGPRNRYD